MTVSKEWAREIDAAQSQRTENLGGTDYERVRYGDDFPNPAATCPDCATPRGKYHVIGCTIERCARCKKGQAVGCNCFELH